MWESNQEKKNLRRRIIRSRIISACKRCFKSKRKCDKEKPTCERCLNSGVKCEYFTNEQLEERIVKRKNIVNDELTEFSKDATIIPDTELNPQPRQSENFNFKLIVNSTGEYSKYFSMGLFPFNDHSANVSLLVNSVNIKSEKVNVFDFSILVKPTSSIKNIKLKIPSRKKSDYLVLHFFQSVYPFIPIVDKEEFFLKYNNFWENPRTFNDLNTLILVFAIFFCSCTSLQLNGLYYEQKSDDLNIDYDSLRLDCFQCIENLKYMLNINITPSLSSIISLALVYYVGSLNCHTNTSQIAMLVKYCQIFGLHRNVSNKTNPVKNLVYSFVWYMDTLGSYYTGFPPNMNQEYFESENNFPKNLSDINILFLLSRLHNSNFWSKVISEINKINKTTIIDYEKIKVLYLNSIQTVTALNNQILNNTDNEKIYLNLLVSETRLGIRKSALLMNVLEYSIYLSDPEKKKSFDLNTELVLQSMLLINESIMKIVFGLQSKRDSLWYIRCSYPFQAMHIVLSHIQKFPNFNLNFSNLKINYDYTTHIDIKIDYNSNDIRRNLIEEAIKVLKLVRPLWSVVFQERHDRIVKFRDFLKEHKKYNYNASLPDNNNDFGDQNTNVRPNSGLSTNANMLDINVNNEANLFETSGNNQVSYLDDGFKFFFAEEYSEENAISKILSSQVSEFREV